MPKFEFSLPYEQQQTCIASGRLIGEVTAPTESEAREKILQAVETEWDFLSEEDIDYRLNENHLKTIDSKEPDFDWAQLELGEIEEPVVKITVPVASVEAVRSTLKQAQKTRGLVKSARLVDEALQILENLHV